MDTPVKPAYDTHVRFSATSIRKRIRIVLRALQNARHHADADEFPDRARSVRRDPAGHAICIPWPQVPDCLHRASCDMRVFAARKMAALSPGTATSAIGC